MKRYLISSLALMALAMTSFGQAVTPCLTMEQAQAQYNQQKANCICVRDTSSQQLQTYYQQLATYWQQRDKDNQQIAKDIQQKNKDVQQAQKDAQQIGKDSQCNARDYDQNLREIKLNDLDKQCSDKLAASNAQKDYDEVDTFIQKIIPLLGDRCGDVTTELKRIHTNRSGGGDGTNPGGHGNLNGFDNPGFLNHH